MIRNLLRQTRPDYALLDSYNGLFDYAVKTIPQGEQYTFIDWKDNMGIKTLHFHSVIDGCIFDFHTQFNDKHVKASLGLSKYRHASYFHLVDDRLFCNFLFPKPNELGYNFVKHRRKDFCRVFFEVYEQLKDIGTIDLSELEKILS